MKEKEYFKKVGETFGLNGELTATIASAQFFIEFIGQDKDTVLAELNLTEEQYEMHKQTATS